MTVSRHKGFVFYFRIGAGMVLLCALLIRLGLPGPVRITSSHTTFKANHLPLKPRLLVPRAFDDGIHTDVFSVFDSPIAAVLIAYHPEKLQTFHPNGPYSNRPPPRG